MMAALLLMTTMTPFRQNADVAGKKSVDKVYYTILYQPISGFKTE
jgi:hypothetical protein